MWMFGLLLLAAAVFEVTGQVTPPAQAMVTLHAATSPFTVSAVTTANGRFRFTRIDAGAYTLSAFVPSRGEVRRTVEVGPGTAGRDGRVSVGVNMDDPKLDTSAAGMVSARELSVPDRARREFTAATKSLAHNDIEDAVKHLERATEIAPQFAAAWNHLGTIAYQTQQFPKAEEYFRRALQADPDSYAPLVNLGGVLINVGKLDEAWKYNLYAVLKRPSDPLANSQLGMTYLALNKLELAEKYLLAALRLDPAHFSHPQLQLAELYLRRNEPRRAADQLEDFLRYHPDYPYAQKVREGIEKFRR